MNDTKDIKDTKVPLKHNEQVSELTKIITKLSSLDTGNLYFLKNIIDNHIVKKK